MTLTVTAPTISASEAYAGILSPYARPWGTQWAENDVRGNRQWLNADVKSLATNNPMIANAIAQSAVYMNGPAGLRPQPRLNRYALGLTEDQAEKLETEFEAIFLDWAASTFSDSNGVDTFGSQMDTATRRAFVTGELLLSFDWRNQFGSKWSTTVRALDPERITRAMTQPLDKPGHLYRNGVELTPDGRIYALHLDYRQEFPGIDQPMIVTGPGTRHLVQTDFGRPLLHLGVLDRAGPGVFRGISPILTAIRRATQSDDLATLVVKQLAAQSEVAWSLVSDMMPDEARAAFGSGDHGVVGNHEVSDGTHEELSRLADWFGVNKLALTSMVSILPPGSKLEATTSNIELKGYETLTTRLITELARAFGMSYSDFSGDYSKDSYSSAKMSAVGPWMLVNRRRNTFVSPAYSKAYSAVLEEAIMKGWLKLPARAEPFYFARDAWTACDWQGPQRINPDELKVAQANAQELQDGTASLASIAAERGTDWKDIAKQRAREKAYFEKLGLSDPYANPAPTPMAVPPDEKEVTQ